MSDDSQSKREGYPFDQEIENNAGRVIRPNSKYKLTNPDNAGQSNEGLVFYYNRERRLENAPQTVKDLYKEQNPKSRFNLFGPLLADRPRKMLFFSIIFLCVVILILSFFKFFDAAYIIDGNKIEITAAVFEGATITVLKKIKSKTNAQIAYTGAVDIAVSPVVQTSEDGKQSLQTSSAQLPVFTHRIFFTHENEEVYRFAIPFESTEMLMIIQNENNKLIIKFKAK